MKVRWTRESVRLRITPTEMDALMAGEVVGESLCLPGGGVWTAAIRPGYEVPTRLDSSGTELTVYLSDTDRERLAVPEAEGVYFGGGDAALPPLRFYIEKDFPCVHPRALPAQERATETFSPPAGFVERKTGADE